MKLIKALKQKNSKVLEYKKTLDKLLKVNSYDVDKKKVYDGKELLKQALALQVDIVKLKTAIHLTSEPIRSHIFHLSELKSFLNIIKGLPVEEGIVKEDVYGRAASVASTMKADIGELEKDALLKQIQENIDTLQETIDYFNATTELVGY